jgi:phosphate uptake regulator
MKRRVVQHGSSTMIISLPSKWVKQYGILKGEELELQQKGNRLEISIEKPVALSSLSLDISHVSPNLLKACIASAYKKGYDEIMLSYTNEYLPTPSGTIKTNAVIRKESAHLIGMEITREDKGQSVIRDVSTPSPKEFENLVRRIWLLLVSQSKAMELASQGDSQAARDLKEENDVVHKLTTYCQRLLNKTSCVEHENNNTYYHIVATLETINHQLLTCAEQSSEDMHTTLHTLMSAYYDLFFKFDLAKAATLIQPAVDPGNRLHTINTLLHHLTEYRISLETA